MSYTIEKHAGGEITNFWPDDTDDEFFIPCQYDSINMLEIFERAKDKWPEIQLDQISIEAQYIHTYCLYYDRYDSGDYTNFIKISKES